MANTKRIETLKAQARLAMEKGDMQKWSDLQQKIRALENPAK